MIPRCARAACSSALSFALFAAASVAAAQPKDALQMEKRETATATKADDPEALEKIPWMPAPVARFIESTTGLAAGLVRDEQIVPRVEETFVPKNGGVVVFPSLFFGSRREPSVGARMLARGREEATSLAASVGGAHDLYLETRVRYALRRPFQGVFALESMFDERSSLKFLGVGQDPDSDPRNAFRASATTHEAEYLEQRSRLLASLGYRVQRDVEIFASASFNRSRVAAPPDPDAPSLVKVFEPGNVVGESGDRRFIYAEIAARFDTRPTLGTPSPGWLLETYVGRAAGVLGDPTGFMRVGGRAAAFIALGKKTRILSPRATLDGVLPVNGILPFTELSEQPDYRGFDTRRDRVSLVGSLDFRQMLTSYLAGRVFADFAWVSPSVEDVFKDGPRFAGGLGFDLFSRSTELGEAAVAFSKDGVTLLLSIGLPDVFGDRQHRY